MWRIARITAVWALLAMTIGAARADTVLPDNGSVEFYDSSGEATFNLSASATLDPTAYTGEPNTYYSVSATFSLYDANGNQITPPVDCVLECFPRDTAQVLDTTYPGYLGPQRDYPTIQYTDLPDGYYTVDISISTYSEDILSPLTFTLTGDIVSDPPAVPLPAALPLFAIGISTLGLFGWRRKSFKPLPRS